MLVNNLMNGFKLSRTASEIVLEKTGISLTVRGENLSELEYVRLAKSLEEYGVDL